LTLQVEPAKTIVKMSDRLFFRYAPIALQPLHAGPGCLCNRYGELRFTGTGGPFEKEWLLEFSREIDNLGHNGIDEVARAR
jgi:hypothetical protein